MAIAPVNRWILCGLVPLAALSVSYAFARPLWHPYLVSITGRRSVQDVINRFGNNAESRLQSRFTAAGTPYPPAEITLVGLKAEKVLELWVNTPSAARKVATYPIKAASGVAGPKLREGDRQVPEGIYRVADLNPNSSYHLSIKLDFPNAFDLSQANAEGLNDPGSDIFIHGKAASVGCLAMGDPAIEELFVLVAKIGAQNVRVIIAPHDPDSQPLLPAPAHLPNWTTVLYRDIQLQLLDAKIRKLSPR